MNHSAPSETPPRYDEIRAHAYLLWQQASCPVGQDLNFWLQAEQQLADTRSETSPKVASSTRRDPGSAGNGSANGSAKRQPGSAKKPSKARRRA